MPGKKKPHKIMDTLQRSNQKRSNQKRIINRLTVMTVLCALFLIWSGCSTSTPAPNTVADVVNPTDRISQAKDYLEVISGLDLNASFQPDVQHASRLLDESETLQKNGRNPESYARADDSVKISRNILMRFYKGTIGKLAREVKKELDEILKDDPENPLKHNLTSLKRIIEYADKLESDPQAIGLNRVLADLEEVVKLSKSIRSGAAVTLASDISFTTGDFILSEKGQKILNAFLDNMLANIDAEEGMSVRIKVKVVGFTDTLNFGANSRFVKKIKADARHRIPNSEPARRQFLNQLLSEHRAQNIAEYIRQYAARLAGSEKKYEVAAEVSGRGEEVPAGVPPPYPTPDDRRRICKIYVHASIQ